MYPSYSGESFDVAQSVGAMLTQDDRDAGLPAPKYGYSSENFDLAESVIREGSGALSWRKVYEIAKSKKASRSRKNPSPTLTVWSVSGSATDRQLGRMFPTGWTRLSDGHIATLASYANKVRGVSANVVGTMPLAEVMRKQIKNPAHLAHPGKFRQGQVVRLRGSRKRYVIATDVDPDVFGYHLVALSGGEVGSAPSGVRANDLELDADQTVSFSGAQAHKLARKYENTARVHQEHQRWLASEYPVSRRANPPRRNPRKYDEGRDDAGFRKLSDLKRGEAFKRKADARKVYRKGDYDRSERKYACDDEDDISRTIYLKGDALVYVGFDY